MTIESLAAVVDDAEAASQTFSIFNYEGPDEVKERVVSYFEPQSVAVRDAGEREGLPKNFAVLHEGEEFIAASGMDELYANVTGDAMLDAERFDRIERPTVLRHVDDRTFTSYDRRRMIIASREIERRAWRERGGELHTGFQRLSLLESQEAIYDRLRESGVDVHVYGEPDAEVPAGLAEHGYDDPEITGTWFVVYDGNPNGDAEDGAESDDGASGTSSARSCAMVAVEQDDETFAGCWTYDSALVDATLEYLRENYPPTRGPARNAE